MKFVMVISNLLVYGGLYFVDDDGEKMEVVLCLLTLYIATDLLILSLFFFFAFPFLFLLSCLIMKFQIYRLFFIKPYVHGLKVAFTVRMSNHFPWER